jgi:hypothetical protein
MERLFTVAEARAMLPRVRVLIEALQESKTAFDRHREAVAVLASRTGEDAAHLNAPLARHQQETQRLAAELRRLLEDVAALGVEVKGIDQGLIDFPSERDGRVVYLCWMSGEPDIAWWHDLDTGFRGRRPLIEG